MATQAFCSDPRVKAAFRMRPWSPRNSSGAQPPVGEISPSQDIFTVHGAAVVRDGITENTTRSVVRIVDDLLLLSRRRAQKWASPYEVRALTEISVNN